MRRIEVSAQPRPTLHRDWGADTVSIFVAEPGTDADDLTEIVLPHAVAWRVYEELEQVL